ncbi:MAG: hypothetical protein WAK07_06860 [Rhodomicrobium sp.]
MKVSELASALNELGAVFKHSKKDEPASCIVQLLKMIEGKEALDISQLVKEAREAKLKKRVLSGEGATRKREFDVARYVTSLKKAETEGEFVAVKRDLERAKPTNDELRRVLQEYAGLSLKQAKKGVLWTALDTSYITKQRSDSRGKIASTELPI